MSHTGINVPPAAGSSAGEGGELQSSVDEMIANLGGVCVCMRVTWTWSAILCVREKSSLLFHTLAFLIHRQCPREPQLNV